MSISLEKLSSYLGQNVKIFDARKCGIVEKDNLFDYFLSVVNYYHALIQKTLAKTVIPVETIVLDNVSVNAYSTVIDNRLVLCINYGTILNIYNFYLKIWTSSLCYPTLGENTSVDKLIVGDPEIVSGKILFPNNQLDLSRQHMAELMAEISIRFIVLHELSHLYHGHTKYFKSRTGFRYLQMQSRSRWDSFNDIRRILELDADSGAARLLISTLNSKITDTVSLYIGQTRNDLENFVLYTLSFLFRFLWNDMIDSADDAGYLFAPYRILTVYDELLRTCNMRPSTQFFTSLDENEFSTRCSQIEDTVTNVLNDTFGMGNNSFVDLVDDEQYYKLYMDTRNNWRNCLKDLLNYTLVPLTRDYRV